VAGEEDQIAGAGDRGQLSRKRSRVVRRLGVGSQHAMAPASTRLARTRSARILEVTSPPPPCNAADGWNVGTSVALPYGYVLPRTLVMPWVVFSSSLVAKLPSVTMTLGSMSSSLASSHGLHASISSGFGSRLPGGLQQTVLPI